ncbi:hypothetical protein PHYC_03799 [Phycisphaerales bacterium]|nr:hypothetical protein PHYC_03799 [Phycisphaerales bacterium]
MSQRDGSSWWFRLLVVPMVFAGSALAQNAAPPGAVGPISPPPGRAPEVQAVPVGPQVPIFGPGNDGPVPRPNHPPIELIPPMPLPEPGPWVAPQSDSVTYFDAETGRTHGQPVIAPSGLPGSGAGGYTGADDIVVPAEWARNFGTMTVAGGLTAFPAAANCKLVMRFVDQGGTDRWFVASGAMQDAGVVLTAAHCVYARNPNGINIFNWASEIWVYPGWDGVGNQGNNGSTEIIQNWGWTRGTFFMAGTDYINNGNFDRDVGAIRVSRGSNRSVGMITGWYGYAWGFDCGTIQSRTYYNFSYPSENCGGGFHTGTTMYFWSGGFDSCPGNQLQLNTTPGCFTAVWGGQSGSNAYYFPDASSRWAHAVCSNSNRSTSGRYAKLWEQFATDLNTFRDGTRGGTFDLEALRFRLTGSTSIQATTATSGIQMLASNTTNADPGNANYTVRVYLSSNSLITSGDTLVGTFNYNWDYVPLQNLTLNLGGVTIPNVAPGTYWLGAILDPATDAFSGNNASSAWDAQQITVTAAPPPAPPNNGCGSAINHSVGASTNGTTANATLDGSATCGSSSSTPDVWYRVVPPISGTVQFDTCGSLYDTVISVHTGCPGTTGNQIACNDDSGALGNCPFTLQSALNVAVSGGTTYYVRVSGFNGNTGNFTLTSQYLPPANDNCSSAAGYSAGSTVGGSLAGATNDGAASCGASGTASDAWYAMTPGASGYLRIDTCGSTFDTVLSVHTACPGTTLNQIACNDDAGVGACAGTLQSVVDVGVFAGTTYYIRVSGFAGSIGDFTLRSQFIAPPNDACANAIAYAAGTSTSGVTTAATNDGSATCGASSSTADVWFQMFSTCTGRLRIDTCGSFYDSVLSVHTGCPGTTANEIACNDDHFTGVGGCPNIRDSALEIDAVGGATYYIRVSGFSGNSGAFSLSSEYLTFGSDDCASAPSVGDGSYLYNICGASNDGPEENNCSFCCGDVQVNNDIWFLYTAPVSGTVTVDTCASAPPTYDTKIAVYSGPCPLGLPDTAIACNDDAGAGCGVSGLLSRATFSSAAGQQYLIRVGGYSTSRGTGTLTIGSAAVPCDPDVNCDGAVNGFDVEATEQAINGDFSNFCQATADLNGDGAENGFDIETEEQRVNGAPC